MSTSSDVKLDRRVIEQLADDLLSPIRTHYLHRPLRPESVYEVLNALAAVSGLVIAAADPEVCRDFFVTALDAELRDAQAEVERIAS